VSGDSCDHVLRGFLDHVLAHERLGLRIVSAAAVAVRVTPEQLASFLANAADEVEA
jgi:hypothetical protein